MIYITTFVAVFSLSLSLSPPTSSPQEAAARPALPRRAASSRTASLVPCNARRGGTSPGPWPSGPGSGPCTRNSWGPRSSSRGHNDTPCSSAAARRHHSPRQARPPGAASEQPGTCRAS